MKKAILLSLAISTLSAQAQNLPSCLDQRPAMEKFISGRVDKRVGTFAKFAQIKAIRNLKFNYLQVTPDTVEVTVSYLMEVSSPSPLKYSTKTYIKAYEVSYQLDQNSGAGCTTVAGDMMESNILFSEHNLSK